MNEWIIIYGGQKWTKICKHTYTHRLILSMLLLIIVINNRTKKNYRMRAQRALDPSSVFMHERQKILTFSLFFLIKKRNLLLSHMYAMQSIMQSSSSSTNGSKKSTRYSLDRKETSSGHRSSSLELILAPIIQSRR